MNFFKTELNTNQTEIPLAGVRWFIDTIEIKFFKPPEEGGLPHDRFSHEEEVIKQGMTLFPHHFPIVRPNAP